MLTQCPNCQTTFRVTSEILRVADGQVRCGRCQTQFDALERLIEENDAGGSPVAAVPARRRRRNRAVPATAGAHRGRRAGRAGRHHARRSAHRDQRPYRVPRRSGRGEPRCARKSIEEWVEIDDVEDRGRTRLNVIASVASRLGRRRATKPADDRGRRRVEAGHRRCAERTSSIAAVRSAHASDARAGDAISLGRRRRAPAAPRDLEDRCAAPLVLLLVVQFVHTLSRTLARHPQLGAPLVGLYGALGADAAAGLEPARVRDPPVGRRLGSATPGTLKVRASVKNLAELRAALSAAEARARRSLGRSGARARVRARGVSGSDDCAGPPARLPRSRPMRPSRSSIQARTRKASASTCACAARGRGRCARRTLPPARNDT